jgi:prepilin-type N-terminal cleavage/methylation domain-containing protein
MNTYSRRARGYTLSEIMIVVTIFGLVMGGVLPFFIMNLKSQFAGEQKLLINGDIRKVTNQMVENAREANSFLIYQAFCAQNRWDGVAEKRDADGNGAVNFFDRMQNGSSGDFVILVYYSDPYFDARFYDGNAGNNPTISSGIVNRIVGYWVAPNRRLAGENAIYSFDTNSYRVGAAATWTTTWGITFPATLSSTVSIESLLPPATVAYSQAAEFPILINDLSGLSNNYTFYNYQNKSIITRCKILHGNQAKRITNTYNFTITPRG